MSGNTSADPGYLRARPPAPPTSDEMTSALQFAIASITGLPGNLVRPRWQAMPPASPPATTSWASVGITSSASLDYPFIIHDDTIWLPGAPGPGVDIMRRNVTLTVIITFYGPQADELAGLLRDGFYIQQNWELLAPFDMKLHNLKDLNRGPELVNQQWIDRVDVEMTVSQGIVRVYPVLTIVGADVVLHEPPVPDETVSVREDTVINP